LTLAVATHGDNMQSPSANQAGSHFEMLKTILLPTPAAVRQRAAGPTWSKKFARREESEFIIIRPALFARGEFLRVKTVICRPVDRSLWCHARRRTAAFNDSLQRTTADLTQEERGINIDPLKMGQGHLTLHRWHEMKSMTHRRRRWN
jgi:hypothetical protein